MNIQNFISLAARTTTNAPVPARHILVMTAILLPLRATAEIERTLQDAILDTSKATQLSQLQRETFRQALDGTSARLIRTISSCLAAPINVSNLASATPRPPLSPYLKPLPAPPVDAELLDLQTELSAACKRVAALRSTVPSQLTQRLTEHLQQCRPIGEVSQYQQLSSPPGPSHEEIGPAIVDTEGHHEADVTAGPPGQTGTDPDCQTVHQGDTTSMTPLSPAPADLQDMYAAAVQRMPALRAKLEEALERMDRVVLAMESDSVHASPYTADLAVQLTDNEAAESVSPALQQALQSGKVVTRKQLTKDVHPVPYAA